MKVMEAFAKIFGRRDKNKNPKKKPESFLIHSSADGHLGCFHVLAIINSAVMKKLWYIYTMEYYSAIKKNSFESALMRWMQLESITQSELNQKDKDHYSILTQTYGI